MLRTFLIQIVSNIVFYLKIIGLVTFSQGYGRVQSFLFYLSIPIDNAIWHARVDVFCVLKPFIKKKATNTIKLHYSHILLLFIFILLRFTYINFIVLLIA